MKANSQIKMKKIPTYYNYVTKKITIFLHLNKFKVILTITNSNSICRVGQLTTINEVYYAT